MRSRLSQTTEKKTKTQLILSLGSIVVILFVLFKFGIPALTSLSLFLSSKNNDTTSSPIATSGSILIPPTLSASFQATNSAKIQVNGSALAKSTILLYVNGSLTDTTIAQNNGEFTFTNVALTQQQNTIQAKAKQDNKTSDYSDTWNVAYIQKAPSLTVDSPHDGDSFGSDKPTVVVSGKTDPDVKVTVNGFWAIVDSNGNYSYTLSLQNGDNHINVVATDVAGNTTTNTLTVKHSQ